MKSRVAGISKNIYSALVFIFLYAPIAVLIIFSFNESKSRGNWGGFSLKWYAKLFSDSAIADALLNTLFIAVTASLVATVIGTLAAIGIHNLSKLPKAAIMNVSYLPVLNADIVTGVSLLILFVFLGINLGRMSLFLAHVTFNIPYVILSVMPKLKQMNKHAYEAALDLGATPMQALVKVLLPEIRPGIVTGAIFAFTLSIDDFVISFFTNGVGVNTLSIYIYSQVKVGVTPDMNALSSLLFFTVLILLAIVNIRSSRDVMSRQKKERQAAARHV